MSAQNAVLAAMRRARDQIELGHSRAAIETLNRAIAEQITRNTGPVPPSDWALVEDDNGFLERH